MALFPDVYNPLSRFDIHWLDAHKPPPLGSWEGTPKINWDELDSQFHQEIVTLYPILRDKQPPQRITVNCFNRELELPKSWLQKQRTRLPLTFKYLNEIVESDEDFALRRLRWVAHDHTRKGVALSKSELIKQAGLSKSVQVEKVLGLVERILQNMV